MSGASDAAVSRSVHMPMTSPPTPPASERSSPSTSSCSTIRPRPAPSARRVAISLRRVVPRASCMLATFRLATSSSTAAIPASVPSGANSPESSPGASPSSVRAGRWTVTTPAVPATVRSIEPADTLASAAFAPSTEMSGRRRPTRPRFRRRFADAGGARRRWRISGDQRVGPERHPQPRAEGHQRAGEACGCDANHRERVGIDRDRPAEHRRRAAQVLPGLEVDHRDRGSAARALFLRREGAAGDETHTERRGSKTP